MDTQQSQQVGAAVAGMMGIFVIVGLLFTAFAVFCFWRIFAKAGMAGALSLLLIIPGIGPLIVVCILAFGEWKVVPVAPYGALPPQYPPPNYPPAV